MKTTFKSKIRPEMNFFLAELEKALLNLPDNPKPSCKGFYLCDFEHKTGILTTEKIGIIPRNKKFKYFQFSIKKVVQTLFFKKRRSKDFENNNLEQYPGGIMYKKDCTGVSGHESMIDEAISLLWMIAKDIKSKTVSSGYEFWLEVFVHSLDAQKEMAPDNQWITIISKLIVGSFEK